MPGTVNDRRCRVGARRPTTRDTRGDFHERRTRRRRRPGTDHRPREVEELFAQIEALPTGDPQRKQLVDEVTRELIRHAIAEEAYVYPEVRKVLPNGDQIADHELTEHSEAERTMKDLEKLEANDPEFDPLVGNLIKTIRHHVQDEEANLFPSLAGR
jgi:hemerythrin superfamily protein